MKLGQLTYIVMGTVLRKCLHVLENWILKSKPFLIYQHTVINEKPIMMSLRLFTLLKMCPETIKKN